MPTKDSAPSFSHTLLMAFQHAFTSFWSRNRLSPDTHVASMMNVILIDHGVSSTASSQTTRPVADIGISQDAVDVRSQVFDNQQPTITEREPAGPPQSPTRTYSSPLDFESDDLEEARQRASGGEPVSNGASPPRSSHSTGAWMVVLVVGILSLIVVPGLTVGIVTRQIPVGIALSGAIATVVSLFAGLYYYHNK